MTGRDENEADMMAVNVQPVRRLPGEKPRLRFWEVANFFKCPLVGMCLTFPEQERLLRKLEIPLKGKSPFEIHEILVASSDSENLVSRRVDDLLDRKFGGKAAVLLGLEAGAFMSHFQTAFASGDYTGVLWAAAIHPGLPVGFKRQIFGEVHMAMHWNAEQRMNISKKMARGQKDLEDLRQSLRESLRERRLLYKEIDNHKHNQEVMQSALDAAEREKSKWAKTQAAADVWNRVAVLEDENRKARSDRDTIQGQLEELRSRWEDLKKENQRLSLEIERLQGMSRHFKEEAEAVIDEIVSLNRCEKGCPSYDLCKKRILIVGGITRMESLYREVVEGSGGVFEYHDGYVKKGIKELEYRLRRADVILCPVGCNSHAACSAVKKLGKKHNKPVHMLSNASVSNVFRVICGLSCDGDGASGPFRTDMEICAERPAG